MNPNQFVVDSLVPENRQGGGIYQLNEHSVSPTRVVSSDEDGNLIEETIPAVAKSAKFVDRDGNICDVALRTGRVPSQEPEAVKYELIVVSDLIRQGQLPLVACPFTHEYAFLKGGQPLVKPPAGAKDCGGKPDGCEHMQKIIKERRAKARDRYDKQQESFRAMNEGDIKRMMETFGKVFGDAVASAAETGRARLAADKNDKDEKK